MSSHGSVVKVSRLLLRKTCKTFTQQTSVQVPLVPVWVTLAPVWVTLAPVWVTLVHVWVTLVHVWVTLAHVWVTLVPVWVTLVHVWVTLAHVWVPLAPVWVTLAPVWVIGGVRKGIQPQVPQCQCARKVAHDTWTHASLHNDGVDSGKRPQMLNVDHVSTA